MRVVISDRADMSWVLQQWAPPSACEELVIDCPAARRFTNCFLDSQINCRVRVVPTTEPAVTYAGLFANCRRLNYQPMLDTWRCINMAAMFKNCESMRFSLHWMQTGNVREMRQMFMGCTAFSGNGPAYWDFSSLATEDSMGNFATGTKFQTRYYDQTLRNLHSQAVAGTLPTPMINVDMGEAMYSPDVAEQRQFLVDYGWDLRDGGEVPISLSPLELSFAESVDSVLAAGDFPGEIDLSAVCTTARNGIAITPRHTVHVRHYMPRPGSPIKFWNGAEATVARCEADPETWDLAIATLDRDVDVTPAMLMPRNYRQLLPNIDGPPSAYPDGTRMPVLWFNRLNQIRIADFTYVATSTPTANIGLPVDEKRLEHFGGIATGDSGSPACLVDGRRLVLSHPIATSNGNGVWVSGRLDWIERLVAATGHSVTFLPER